MSIEERDQVCSDLIEKMSSGQHLSDAEKAHLVGCEGCMAAVVHHLDKLPGAFPSKATTPASMADNGSAQATIEAQQALTRGRRFLNASSAFP